MNTTTAPSNGIANQPINEKGNRRGGVGFGGWFKLHILDLLTMAVMGAIGLGVYFAPPAPTRSFPITFSDGEIVYPQYAYPLRKEIIPIWLAALLAFIVPFLFFVLAQVRRRSLFDLLETTFGLVQSLITAAVFQVFIKWLIGGFRPHFLAVCKPNVSGPGAGTGYQLIYYTIAVCTGDKKQINDSLESFPSGHATAAFAGFIYLALYINAQLKVNSDHRPAFWKIILFFAPILGATLIAGALTIDKFHHWYDVVMGAIIGTAAALICFRATFASVWDFRFNHVILPRAARHMPGERFAYSHAEASEQLPVTRQGGWGQNLGAAGAPFDASALGGMGAGGGGGGGFLHRGPNNVV